MFALGTGAHIGTGARGAPMNMIAIGGAEAEALPLVSPVSERIHLRSASLNVLAGHRTSVTGSLRPRIAGAKIGLQLLFGRRWITVAHTRTGAHGRYRLRYTPRRTGSWRAQLRYFGAGGASGSGSAAAGATRRLGVLSSFRAAAASWYGGGGGLACGGQLTSYTMGVANRTLPCGTWLTLRYGDRSVRVQVIDRGPYVEGREFDLTEATKRALGFEGVGVLWATR